MQDLHAIGDGSGGGKFIGVGDLRLRPHNHQQALKCPRCDSLNTKFCYYNNYNHSQPRHFCKSCRRYWTKGGILRNVPVGGGCRKTKRSKAKTTADSSSGDAQSSSSDSSNLTAAAAATAEEGSAPSNTASSNSAVVYNVDVNPNFDHQPLDEYPSTDGQIFSTEMGSFAALMASPEVMMAAFGTADIQTTSYGRGQLPVDHAPAAENPSLATVDEFKMEDMSNDGLAAALDWGGGGGGGDQGLFDLTAGVDPGYWDQSEWTDNDQSLNYLP